MSIYLSKYYCGNLENKCNYEKPLDYTKITNRQFINTLSDMTSECDKIKGKKGLCCDKKGEDMDKTINKKYMEEINEKTGMEVFNSEKIRIPLVRVNNDKDNNIKNIDICNCSGTENYKECVAERCQGYKEPTRYEYCKMGDLGGSECIVEGPALFEEDEENDLTSRCKLKPLVEDRINIRIDDLMNDCYNSECEKRGNLDMLVNRYTTDNKYYKLGDSLTGYKYDKKKDKLKEEMKDKTLRDYLTKR